LNKDPSTVAIFNLRDGGMEGERVGGRVDIIYGREGGSEGRKEYLECVLTGLATGTNELPAPLILAFMEEGVEEGEGGG